MALFPAELAKQGAQRGQFEADAAVLSRISTSSASVGVGLCDEWGDVWAGPAASDAQVQMTKQPDDLLHGDDGHQRCGVWSGLEARVYVRKLPRTTEAG